MELAEELAALEEAWANGQRDVATARRLLFLAWYVFVEPPEFTGNCKDVNPRVVQEELIPAVARSAEVDFESALVLGHIAGYTPYFFGGTEAWLLRAQTCFRDALNMARRDGRTKKEQRLIKYRLRAATETRYNVLPPSKEGCFPDMFLGDSAYDEYFAWIFSGRSASAGEGYSGPPPDSPPESLWFRLKAEFFFLMNMPLQLWAVRGLLAFFVLGLLASIPCMCREGVVIASYTLVFYIIVLARLLYGVLRQRLTPIDYLAWVGAFVAFCIIAGCL
jgi:hypothetical protein